MAGARCRFAFLCFAIEGMVEHAVVSSQRRTLRRVRRELGDGEGGGKERATGVHSMIWSARASSDGGIVRPRALAVFKFTCR